MARRSYFHRAALMIRAAIIGLLLTSAGVLAPRVGHAQGVVGGVYVDAAGMLRESDRLSADERLNLLRADASDVASAGPVAAVSPLRKVSLRKLEQAVEACRKAGQPLPAEVRQVAGLQAVRYVFFYPEAGDVVLAGPAEGWKQLPSGDVVGEKSGRPALHLDDLIVALRYAFATDPVDAFLGCSIEPTEEGMKRHDGFLRGLSLDRSRSAEIVRGMEQAMGPQRILLYGAPASSRFALQMLAADYRLKRLALDHDPSPSKNVPSYLDLATKSIAPGPQPQHRWWFVGQFDAIRHTPDKLAFELAGAGLRVDTAPAAKGSAPPAKHAKPSRAATQFAELATRHFPELARKIPPFAELQNLVSLAVAAELIRQSFEPQPHVAAALTSEIRNPKSEIPPWRPRHFLDPGTCPIAAYQVPRETPSLANVRIVQDQHWLFSISGGVELDPGALTAADRLKSDPKLDVPRTAAAPPIDDDRWWWD